MSQAEGMHVARDMTSVKMRTLFLNSMPRYTTYFYLFTSNESISTAGLYRTTGGHTHENKTRRLPVVRFLPMKDVNSITGTLL